MNHIDEERLIIWGIVASIIALLVFAIKLDIEEQREWKKFSIDHQCKLTSTTQVSYSTGTRIGITGDGQIGTVVTTNYESGKNAYLCDDGVTYWRNK